jgi:dolichyl-phosphate-mannose-protein mannosyltransferase
MFTNISVYLKNLNLKNWFILYSLLILSISFFTFFLNYQNPPAPFWDENYHIAAAYKYNKGTFFLELHPPLGKMLIGAGEQVFGSNKDLNTNTFLTKEYLEGKDFNNFSFVGVRFFPALFAFLGGYLFFVLLFVISKNPHLSALFSSLFLFENALIVHFRGAMLDGIQMFFILSSLIYFVLLWRKAYPKKLASTISKPKLTLVNYFILGSLIGFAVSVKINAMILGFLVACLLFWEYSGAKIFEILINTKLNNFWNFLKKEVLPLLPILIAKGAVCLFGISLIFGFFQYLHLNIAKNVVDNKYYDISSDYKEILEKRDFTNPLNTWITTKNWYDLSQRHSKGVPKLDVCKPGENGSYPADWPLMNRTISYRWQKYAVQKNKHFTYSLADPEQKYQISLNDFTNLKTEEKSNYVVPVKYLYLIGNPAIWLIGLLGLIMSISLVLARLFFGLKTQEDLENAEEIETNQEINKPKDNFSWSNLLFKPNKNELVNKTNYYFNLILVFLSLYGLYMFSVLKVERVLYLYHYFVAFVFSLILAFLVFNFKFNNNLKQEFSKTKNLYIILGVLVLIIFVSFVFFAPFTYYLPLTKEEFEMRNWLYFWQLKNVG